MQKIVKLRRQELQLLFSLSITHLGC